MPVVINSKFKPFSYAEMLLPVMMATQAHQALEDSYSELDTKASMWEKLADSAIDKDVYQQYKAYADNLRALSDRLALEGLTPSARRNMLDMRSRYALEITPIEEAYAERQRQARVQLEMMLKDPTHMYRTNANEVGLRLFMNNPNYDTLTENYSGALLTQQVGQAAANLKTALTEKGKLLSLGLPYQYERMLQYGYTPEQVMQAMSKDPKAAPILNKIVDDVMASSGIRDWGNEALTQRAEAFARQGLYNAIGQTKFDNFKDDYNMQLGVLRAKQKMEEEQRLNALKMFNVRPTTYYTESQIAKMNKPRVDEIDKYVKRGFITKDGKLTQKGYNELINPSIRVTPARTGRGPTGAYDIPETKTKINQDFITFANNTVKLKGVKGKNNIINTFNAYSTGIVNGAREGKLITGDLNIDVYRQPIMNSTLQGFVADQITANIGEDGKVYQIGALSENNGKPTFTKGKGFTMKEFREEVKDNPILYVVNSPTTDESGTQFVQLTNGKQFLLPAGVIDNISQGYIEQANEAARQSGSYVEAMTNLNRSNSYLGSIYGNYGDTEIKPNDGTITIPFLPQ